MSKQSSSPDNRTIAERLERDVLPVIERYCVTGYNEKGPGFHVGFTFDELSALSGGLDFHSDCGARTWMYDNRVRMVREYRLHFRAERGRGIVFTADMEMGANWTNEQNFKDNIGNCRQSEEIMEAAAEKEPKKRDRFEAMRTAWRNSRLITETKQREIANLNGKEPKSNGKTPRLKRGRYTSFAELADASKNGDGEDD